VRKNKKAYNQWSLSKDYYLQAIKVLKERFKYLVIVFFVGGSLHNKIETMEDRSWVLNTLMKKTSDERTIVVMEPDNVSDLVIFETMSKFDAMAISASSFTWWSAYLSNSSVVIAPRYILEDIYFSAQDYYPPEWILLDEKSVIAKESAIVNVSSDFNRSGVIS